MPPLRTFEIGVNFDLDLFFPLRRALLEARIQTMRLTPPTICLNAIETELVEVILQFQSRRAGSLLAFLRAKLFFYLPEILVELRPEIMIRTPPSIFGDSRKPEMLDVALHSRVEKWIDCDLPTGHTV